MFGVPSAALGMRPMTEEDEIEAKLQRLYANNDRALAAAPAAAAQAEIDRRMYGPVRMESNPAVLPAVLPDPRPLLPPGSMRNPSPEEVFAREAPRYTPAPRGSLADVAINGPVAVPPAPAAAPASPFETRTFTSPAGVRSYEMTPGYASYTGRGNEFGRPVAIDVGQGRDLFTQQLTDAAKDMALMDPRTQGLLELERTRSEGDVREREAARRDFNYNKILEMANANRMRTLEAGGSEAAGQKVFDDTMRANRAVLPAETLSRLGLSSGPAPAAAPRTAENIVQDQNRSDLQRIVREGVFNRGMADVFGERLSSVPAEKRSELIQQLLQEQRAPGAPGNILDLGDAVAKSLFYDTKLRQLPYEGLPFQYDGREIVLPGGRKVPVSAADRPNWFQRIVGGGPAANEQHAAAALQKRAALSEFLKALYGEQR